MSTAHCQPAELNKERSGLRRTSVSTAHRQPAQLNKERSGLLRTSVSTAHRQPTQLNTLRRQTPQNATDRRVQAAGANCHPALQVLCLFQLLFQKTGHVHTAVFKTDNQQGPPVRRRELCSRRVAVCAARKEHMHACGRVPCCPPGTLTMLLIRRRLCARAQSRPPPCDAVDCSPPGSSARGISQARILKQVAIPYSTGSS